MGMGDMEGSIDGMDGGAMAGASMGMGETGMPGAPGMMAPPPATAFDPAESSALNWPDRSAGAWREAEMSCRKEATPPPEWVWA